MARQVAYGEATARDAEGRLVSRATGTFLLHRDDRVVRFGIALGRMHPSMFLEAVAAADELGFESVVVPRTPRPAGGHGRVALRRRRAPSRARPRRRSSTSSPTWSFLAGRTSRVRLGTHVYNLGPPPPLHLGPGRPDRRRRCPQGRLELGVGAGWLRGRMGRAAGLDFDSRGRPPRRGPRGRADGSGPRSQVEHHGALLRLRPGHVRAQAVSSGPTRPSLIGGESPAALAPRRPPRRLDRAEPQPRRRPRPCDDAPRPRSAAGWSGPSR